MVKEHGYAKVFYPVIKDLITLEEQWLHLEQLGASIKGTVLFVTADNLAAHGLAGFQESILVNHVCKFCMASRDKMPDNKVKSGFFQL